jgi:hypothetical protein
MILRLDVIATKVMNQEGLSLKFKDISDVLGVLLDDT